MKKKRLIFYFVVVVIGMAGLSVFAASCKSQTPRNLDETGQAGASAKGDIFEGERLLKVYGCLSCHQIGGIRIESTPIGPPLADWKKRTYISGKIPNNPRALIRWLQDPQHIEPGTAMPDLGVTEEEARAMAAYLFSQ